MAKRKPKPKKETVQDIAIRQSGNVEEIRAKLNEDYKSLIAPPVEDKPAIILPTGILSFDLAIGNSGFVGGRIADIFGWEATGKTLTCLAIGAYIQRCTKIDIFGKVVNRVVAMLDAEGTFSYNVAVSVGMDTENLILVQSTPDKILTGEDFFDIMVMLVGLGVDYVIVDSCPALAPSQIVLNATGQGQKATRAQLMTAGLEKLTPIVNANGQTVVHFINQMRGKPMAQKWESSEYETGGNALKFFSSYRFMVVKAEDINKKVLGSDNIFREKKVGVTSCVRIKKSKVASIPAPIPSTTYHFEFDVYFESFKDESGVEFHRGVDVVKDYALTGIRTGVIEQKGSWYNFGDIKGQGFDDLMNKLRIQPEVLGKIRDEVFVKMGHAPTSPMESTLNGSEEDQE